jgi:hypothetical protein
VEDGQSVLNDYDETSYLPPMWTTPSDQNFLDESYDAPISEEEGAYDVPANDDYNNAHQPVTDFSLEGSEPSVQTTNLYGYGDDQGGLRRRHIPNAVATTGDDAGIPVHSQSYAEFEEEVGDYEYQEFSE